MAVVLWVSTVAGRSVAFPGLPLGVTVSIVVIGWVSGRGRLLVVCAVLAGLAGGSREWAARPVPTGPCAGWARLRTDPRGTDRFASFVLQLGSHRLAATANGGLAARATAFRAGELVKVEGECSPVPATRRSRLLISHVTGMITVRRVDGPALDGGGMWRGANRVRQLAAAGTRGLADSDRALFAGLVLGDDSRQARSMVDDFRESGLAHLCSASGQNVAYLMAAVSPLLRRLTATPRLVATFAVISWFVFLTRAEPSVMRAAVMAAVSAVNLHAGRPANGRRVLATAVAGLVVVDPMLAFSVGFMLSVGATAGLAWLSRPLTGRLGLPAVVAATLAAQIGTLPVMLAVFGRVSFVALLANPLAVPVAGFVMLVGLPVAVVSALAPSPVGTALCLLLAVPVRFVGTVAHVGAGLEPHGPPAFVCWAAAVVILTGRLVRRRHVAG